jgi:hypothetical protein
MQMLIESGCPQLSLLRKAVTTLKAAVSMKLLLNIQLYPWNREQVLKVAAVSKRAAVSKKSYYY